MSDVSHSVSNLSEIEVSAERIVDLIGRESVDVYVFLSEMFGGGSINENRVFQFVYRSFYGLDNAGLTPEFKSKYFALLEEARGLSHPDLRSIARTLYPIPHSRGYKSLQFSFITKLAHTVNQQLPIYDGKIATLFGFEAPSGELEGSLTKYMSFYEDLRRLYAAIVSQNLLPKSRALFADRYSPSSSKVSDIKALDFIFWASGKLGFRLENL
jgi:hypothetical protein